MGNGERVPEQKACVVCSLQIQRNGGQIFASLLFHLPQRLLPFIEDYHLPSFNSDRPDELPSCPAKPRLRRGQSRSSTEKLCL